MHYFLVLNVVFEHVNSGWELKRGAECNVIRILRVSLFLYLYSSSSILARTKLRVHGYCWYFDKITMFLFLLAFSSGIQIYIQIYLLNISLLNILAQNPFGMIKISAVSFDNEYFVHDYDNFDLAKEIHFRNQRATVLGMLTNSFLMRLFFNHWKNQKTVRSPDTFRG